MPLYTAITEDGFVSDEKKAKIAKEITRIHATVMKVPSYGKPALKRPKSPNT